jgi:hypothetical protein
VSYHVHYNVHLLGLLIYSFREYGHLGTEYIPVIVYVYDDIPHNEDMYILAAARVLPSFSYALITFNYIVGESLKIDI